MCCVVRLNLCLLPVALGDTGQAQARARNAPHYEFAKSVCKHSHPLHLYFQYLSQTPLFPVFMSQEIPHADVAIWLSQISSSPTPSPEPTPARSKCLPVCGTKRKRHTADIPESKCQRRTKKLRPALQDIPLGPNTMETPEASPRKGRGRGRPQIPNTVGS